MRTGRKRIGALLAITSLVAACGGDDDSESAPTVPVATTLPADRPVGDTTSDTSAAPEETSPPTTDSAADPLQTLRAATVKISSQGTFVDPAVGAMYNVAGVGTGFIIDPSGIVVTNNHVVTGSALLEVFLNDVDRPVNAQVLGVSECSDLAVIDLEGDGYTALSFADASSIIEGLGVYAAGYPLTTEGTIEDVDYTLTRGIVSSTASNGETSWASVDSVIEHDARIRGGNSGGPLVNDAGEVVGVNYAGLDSADQNFAIAIDEAMPIIERLRSGENVESLGINGQAVFDEEAGINGIWVASVETGSPAGTAGIQAGDIITTLENLVLATDGTMSDYCDIVRTRGEDAVYRVEVLRYATEEVLAGEINGTPLEQSFSFAQEVEEPDAEAQVDETFYTDYVTVSDDSGAVSVSVPVEWSDTNGAPNEAFGPSIYAAPDLDGFLNTWEVPGVILEVSGDLGADSIGTALDEIGPAGACTNDGRFPYEDPLYIGEYDLWSDCGGVGTTVITLAVTPHDGSYLIRLGAQIVTDRDLDALDQIMNSFIATV